MPIIALCLGFLLSSVSLFGEAVFLLPRQVVTAAKYPQDSQKNGVHIQVITEEELSVLGVQTLKEALNTISSLHLTESAGQNSVYSRGMAANHTKVMIDGVSLTDAISPQGTPYLDTISLAAVDHLEVITGASGVIQGSAAVGGVINIITKKTGSQWRGLYSPQKKQSDLSFTYSAPQISAGFGLGFEETHTMSALKDTQEIDGWSKHFFRGYGNYDTAGLGQLSLTFMQSAADFNLDNDYTHADDPNFTLHAQQNITKIKFTPPACANFQPAIAYSQANIQRHSLNPTDNIDPISFMDMRYLGRTEEIEANVLTTFTAGSADLKILSGFDLQQEKAESAGNFGDFQAEQNTSALYTQLNSDNDWLSFHLGGRLSKYGEQNFSSCALAFYRNLPGLDSLLKFSRQTGYRLPTLYEKNDVWAGNHNLRPEYAVSNEITLEKNVANALISLSLFENTISDKIDYNFSSWKYEQGATTCHSNGWETELLLRNWLGCDFLKLNYTKTNAHWGTTDALRLPENKLSLAVAWSIEDFTLSLTGLAIGERYDQASSQIVLLAPYYLVNSNLIYKLDQHLRLNLKIENIFNVKYEEVAGYNTAGMLILLGFLYDF